MTGSVTVLPTGTANLASVLAAFRRLGADAVLASSIDDVAGATRLVLPGVGRFGAAARSIDGARELLSERIDDGRPTLAICVGMQLLAEKSEESPEVAGLGLVEAGVERFGSPSRVPQLGWNEVVAGAGCRTLNGGWAYFANSYCLRTVPSGWAGATSNYDGTFVSGLERGAVLATQFHPELSGGWGADLLRRWLEAAS